MFSSQRVQSIRDLLLVSGSSGGSSRGRGSRRALGGSGNGGLNLLEDTSEETLVLITLLSDSQEDRDERTVLGLSDDAASNTDDLGLSSVHVGLEVAVVGLAVRRRHEHGNILTNNVDERVSQEILSSLVETVDGTLGVDNDGRDDQSIQNLALLLQERLLLDLSLGLLQDTDEVQLSGSHGLLRNLQVDGHDGAILLNSNNVTTLSNNTRNTSLEVVTQEVIVIRLSVLSHQNVNVTTNEFRLIIAKGSLDLLVDVLNDTSLGDDDDRVQDELEHGEHIRASLSRQGLLNSGSARGVRLTLIQVELDTVASTHSSLTEALLQISLTLDGDLISIRIGILDTKTALELIFQLTTDALEGGGTSDLDGVPVITELALNVQTIRVTCIHQGNNSSKPQTSSRQFERR